MTSVCCRCCCCCTQTLGSDLNGVDRQPRDFIAARYSCAGGQTSPGDLDPAGPFARAPAGISPGPSVNLDPGPLFARAPRASPGCRVNMDPEPPFARAPAPGASTPRPRVDMDSGSPFARASAVPASGVPGGRLGGFAATPAGDVEQLPRGGSDHVDSKPPGAGSADLSGRRSNLTVTGRSPPGSNKTAAGNGVSSSAGSSIGNGSAMYETGTGNANKHRKLDYVTGGSELALNRSPEISSSAASTGSSSSVYETGTGNDIKHQQLDYVGGGGGLLSSDPLHYYPHLGGVASPLKGVTSSIEGVASYLQGVASPLKGVASPPGGVASSAGFSPYQPRHHAHHHPGSHAHHHHQVLSPAGTAAYQPYAMPDLVGDYTSTSAFFHSNVFKAAAAASQIRTKSHSSSG